MEYSDANSYFIRRFGVKVYKAAISLDVTCPNRDGTKGNDGCIFCSSGGSGEFSQDHLLSVTEQIDRAIEALKRKSGRECRYIAYFQSFTNTYISADILREKIAEAMAHPLVVMVSIATRPDCLPDDILDVLADANKVKPIMVELGLQTMHDETAKWFNRCYETRVFGEAVTKLKEAGCEVICHLIFGLKGESEEMMLQSVKFAAETGIDGIKFTCLYVLKGTRLYDEYLAGEIKPLEMDEYFDIVEKALEILPEKIIVHRLTGDGPKKILVAPMWTANKRNVVNYINRRFQPRRAGGDRS